MVDLDLGRLFVFDRRRQRQHDIQHAMLLVPLHEQVLQGHRKKKKEDRDSEPEKQKPRARGVGTRRAYLKSGRLDPATVGLLGLLDGHVRHERQVAQQLQEVGHELERSRRAFPASRARQSQKRAVSNRGAACASL